MRYDLNVFEKFLHDIDLNAYRETYSRIKTVEMDLPRDIQALDTIYDIYWNDSYVLEGAPLTFDEFYDEYYKRCESKINDFWDKSGFDKECQCFQRGLKARIYRTWASIITQIHAGYVAESVFGKGSVRQSTELDHSGIDMLVNYKGNEIKIQIKKESKRPEISRMYRAEVNSEGFYNIWYIVPSKDDYNNPFYKVGAKKGQYRECVKHFVKYNKENGTLDRLNNGFVIFTKKEFELIKREFDK